MTTELFLLKLRLSLAKKEKQVIRILLVKYGYYKFKIGKVIENNIK